MLRKILVFGIHLNYTIETIAPICVLVELPKVWQERMAISRDRLWPFKVSNLIKVVGNLHPYYSYSSALFQVSACSAKVSAQVDYLNGTKDETQLRSPISRRRMTIASLSRKVTD